MLSTHCISPNACVPTYTQFHAIKSYTAVPVTKRTAFNSAPQATTAWLKASQFNFQNQNLPYTRLRVDRSQLSDFTNLAPPIAADLQLSCLQSATNENARSFKGVCTHRKGQIKRYTATRHITVPCSPKRMELFSSRVFLNRFPSTFHCVKLTTKPWNSTCSCKLFKLQTLLKTSTAQSVSFRGTSGYLQSIARKQTMKLPSLCSANEER